MLDKHVIDERAWNPERNPVRDVTSQQYRYQTPSTSLWNMIAWLAWLVHGLYFLHSNGDAFLLQLAVALDKVRSDHSLLIWDVESTPSECNRLNSFFLKFHYPVYHKL